MARHSLIIKDTHRGLRYENGVLKDILGAGRYDLPTPRRLEWLWSILRPLPQKVEIVLMDMRERDLTIKGQEILTADKVAIRVSIVVQFRVTDPQAAKHQVEDYEARLYTDVQLAARRSLATMTLEEILTNRNRLSEDILSDVKELAAGYGILILRADVKDLIFPGNLQEIMNRVLAAERMSQAQLVEARTKAETQRIEAQTKAEMQQLQQEAALEAQRRSAEVEAQIEQIKTQAELQSLQERQASAQVYSQHPALLRLVELQTLYELAQNANARIYINFEGQTPTE
jgi:regulator of protease activity HflC (stomatin/prohibitin superfamily)